MVLGDQIPVRFWASMWPVPVPWFTTARHGIAQHFPRRSRTKGGVNTNLNAPFDSHGCPLDPSVTAEQVSDNIGAALLGGLLARSGSPAPIPIPSSTRTGRPYMGWRKPARYSLPPNLPKKPVYSDPRTFRGKGTLETPSFWLAQC